jgi:hypothetical protein
MLVIVLVDVLTGAFSSISAVSRKGCLNRTSSSSSGRHRSRVSRQPRLHTEAYMHRSEYRWKRRFGGRLAVENCQCRLRPRPACQSPLAPHVVEMMLDATTNYAQPLTANQLFGWHAALSLPGITDPQAPLQAPPSTNGWCTQS